jgi:glycogen synthase
VLRGIINGIDMSEWDPAADKHLPATYKKETLDVRACACVWGGCGDGCGQHV